jgi:hypothetical protein
MRIFTVISAISFAFVAAGCAASAGEDAPAQDDSAIKTSSAIKLPQKLTCAFTNDGAKETDAIYTRLANVKDRSQLTTKGLQVWGEGSSNHESPKKDEIADGWRGDYYSADISKTEFRYNLWTCDSEDRAYTFKTNNLVLPASSSLKTKSVEGKVNISVRDDGADYVLRCTAHY